MDIYEQIFQLQRQVDEMQRTINALKSEATIPFNIREAFKASIGSSIAAQTPTATTYAKSVSESGSNTYNVSRLMDGTIPIILNGQVYYLPYYN